MKARTARVVRAIPVGAIINCADNSGARLLKVIGVKGYKGRKRRLPAAGVGDLVICSVVDGKPEMRHKIVHAVIIRQKKEYRRYSGIRIKFEDNAAVLIKPETGDPVGSEIKGVVAKEAIERFPKISSAASRII
jgi:large subunit ribosomal protein L14